MVSSIFHSLSTPSLFEELAPLLRGERLRQVTSTVNTGADI